MRSPSILAFAGSTRKESLNKLLIDEAIGLMTTTGARVTKVDLADYPLPLYDGDLETDQGLPENAKILKSHMIEHDGILIASPEYNGAITAVLKTLLTGYPGSSRTNLRWLHIAGKQQHLWPHRQE